VKGILKLYLPRYSKFQLVILLMSSSDLVESFMARTTIQLSACSPLTLPQTKVYTEIVVLAITQRCTYLEPNGICFISNFQGPKSRESSPNLERRETSNVNSRGKHNILSHFLHLHLKLKELKGHKISNNINVVAFDFDMIKWLVYF
jgi:hypothetical protein